MPYSIIGNMSQRRHIVYVKNTSTEGRKMIANLLPLLGIACAAATGAAGATSIYLIKFKLSEPISREEADILWKLHKNADNCASRKWKPRINKKGQITGFKCQCGYRYTQKRSVLSEKTLPPQTFGVFASR